MRHYTSGALPCVVSPNLLEFGQVEIGSSSVRTFEIRNTGAGTLDGNVSESCFHFSLVSGSGSYSLSAGQTRNVTVRFWPEFEGPKECLIDTGDAHCNSVTVRGVGWDPPRCNLEWLSWGPDFGTVPVGTDRLRTLIITNTGGGTLTGSVGESCSQFSVVSGGGSYSLGAGQTRNVTVRFAPTSSGLKECVLDTGHDDCNSVVLRGIGGDPPPICYWWRDGRGRDLGTVDVGSSRFATLFVRNDGGGTLFVDVTESCPHYSLIFGSNPDWDLGPGESNSVGILYQPTSAGTHNCTINLGSPCGGVSYTGVGQ